MININNFVAVHKYSHHTPNNSKRAINSLTSHQKTNIKASNSKHKLLCSRSSLKILSWNIQSRNLKYEGNQFFIPEFQSLIAQNDIVCLQETKNPIKFENYRCFNNLRPGGSKAGGGVAILINNEISKGITQYKTPHINDVITIKLHKNYFHTSKDTYIMCVYISPESSPYRKRQPGNPCDAINDLISDLNNKGEIIVCGDFNSRTSTEPDFIENVDIDMLDLPQELHNNFDQPNLRNNQDKFINKDGKELLDSCVTNDIHIINGRTLGDIFGMITFFGARGTSCPDYFLASDAVRQRVTYMKVLPFTRFSDHCPLTMRVDLLNKFHINNNIHVFEKFPARFKWDENSAQAFSSVLNSKELLDQFKKIAESEKSGEFTFSTAENAELCGVFTNALISAADRSLQKNKLPNNLPKHKWFTYECRKNKRSLNRAARRVLNNPGNDTLRKEFYATKRAYNACLSKNKAIYVKNINEAIKNGKVLYWRKFKFLKSSNEDKQVLDNHDLLNFCDYFEELIYKLPISQPIVTPRTLNLRDAVDSRQSSSNNISFSSHTTTSSDESPHERLNTPITIDETKISLKSLNIGKSVAEDLVSNEMLKHLNEEGVQAVTCLFNHCLQSGSYPWHTSIITPIHKSGDQYNPDNYRAIAVSSCLGKTFSNILLQRLLTFRDECCKDPATQLGFSKGAQTNDHILTLKTIVDKKKREKLVACFVDLKKAFDTIPRDLLLHKLVSLNIQGDFFAVIQSMYDNSHAKIKINNILSNKFKVQKGTEQGHPMSPDLFKLYIRDLSTMLSVEGKFPDLSDTIINHLLWADDLVLLALDYKSMQTNLDILQNFCNTWGLTVNMKKTKIIQFGTSKRNAYTFLLGSDTVEIVKTYCYLGIIIHQNGSFKCAIDELRKKALRARFALMRVISKTFISFSSLLILFDSLIKPILLYGCQVLAPYSYVAKKSL